MGAALLSKRQSVAFGHHGALAPHQRVAPAVPSMPTISDGRIAPAAPTMVQSSSRDRAAAEQSRVPVIQPTGSHGVNVVALSQDRFDAEKCAYLPT